MIGRREPYGESPTGPGSVHRPTAGPPAPLTAAAAPGRPPPPGCAHRLRSRLVEGCLLFVVDEAVQRHDRAYQRCEVRGQQHVVGGDRQGAGHLARVQVGQ